MGALVYLQHHVDQLLLGELERGDAGVDVRYRAAAHEELRGPLASRRLD
jgi:hypothetical protein